MLIATDAARSIAFCFLADANPHEMTIKVSGGDDISIWLRISMFSNVSGI
jgi:hypothetical protein